MAQPGTSRKTPTSCSCAPPPDTMSFNVPGSIGKSGGGSRCSTHSLAKVVFRWQGLAHCFEKDDNGKLKDVMVIEPLAANSLEGMMAGACDPWLCEAVSVYIAPSAMHKSCRFMTQAPKRASRSSRD